MLVLNAEEVRKALPMSEAMEAMKNAYASFSSVTAIVPGGHTSLSQIVRASGSSCLFCRVAGA